MAVAGTEETLTVDANVISYYFTVEDGHVLQKDLKVTRMNDFSKNIIGVYKIAINRNIEMEYRNVIGDERAKLWLKECYKDDLIVDVPNSRLIVSIRVRLRDDYGFDIRSKDMIYIETCSNTILKRLITENTNDFKRKNKARRKRSMDSYIKKELKIEILTIDECCELYA